MKSKRRIIVYIATSVDGFIARPDGDVEWLNRRPRTVDYGMREFYPTIDTILWGRKTYDWLLAYYKAKGEKTGMFDTRLANCVFSRKPPKRVAAGATFVSEPVKAFARRLRFLEVLRQQLEVQTQRAEMVLHVVDEAAG